VIEALLRRGGARVLLLAVGAIVGCVTVQVSPSAVACNALTDLQVLTPEIRLVVLYTKNAAAATWDIEGEITLAVEEMNAAFLRSGVDVRAEIAHMEVIDLPGDVATGVTVLASDLKTGTGPLAAAHALRTQWHGDVVVLVAVPAGGGGSTFTMKAPSLAFETEAFLVVDRSDMGSQLTLTHEMGHILGSAHQRPVSSVAQPKYGYAYPHVCTYCVLGALTGWRTIMAGNTAPWTTRVEYFSNPDVFLGAEPTGVSSLDPNAEDNRQTFSNTAPIVAAFRLTPSWIVSAGAASPWFEKRVADELLSDVAFADFDGNGETDAFKIDPLTRDWQIARGASRPWEFLNTDPTLTPLNELRFADFDGDGTADVFRSDVTAKTWFVSRGGTSAWQSWNGPSPDLAIPVAQLAFGQFEAGGGADVLWVDATTHQWFIVVGGTGLWVKVNGPNPALDVPMTDLRFGDFDGDGVTDVFRSDVATGTWFWSQSASSDWKPLNGPSPDLMAPVSSLAFGDFDGDKTTDVLVAQGVAWGASAGGSQNPKLIKMSCTAPGNVAVGDFDGDGTADVIRAGIRP
jgi:hypothetical protein